MWRRTFVFMFVIVLVMFVMFVIVLVVIVTVLVVMVIVVIVIVCASGIVAAISQLYVMAIIAHETAIMITTSLLFLF